MSAGGRKSNPFSLLSKREDKTGLLGGRRRSDHDSVEIDCGVDPAYRPPTDVFDANLFPETQDCPRNPYVEIYDREESPSVVVTRKIFDINHNQHVNCVTCTSTSLSHNISLEEGIVVDPNVLFTSTEESSNWEYIWNVDRQSHELGIPSHQKKKEATEKKLHGKIQVEVIDSSQGDSNPAIVEHFSPLGDRLTFEAPYADDDPCAHLAGGGIPSEVDLPKDVGDSILRSASVQASTNNVALSSSIDQEDLSNDGSDEHDIPRPMSSSKDATLVTGATVNSSLAGESSPCKPRQWWSRMWRRGPWRRKLDSSDIARMVEATLAEDSTSAVPSGGSRSWECHISRRPQDSRSLVDDIEVASTADSHELVLLDEDEDYLWTKPLRRREETVRHNNTTVL